MRKIGLILFITLVIFFAGELIYKNKQTVKREDTALNDEVVKKDKKNSTILFSEGEELEASWIITEGQNINLYPNFKKHLTTQEFLEKKNCKSLISGGFYQKEDKPIGLFVADGKKISNESKNTLFNGFFYKDKKGEIYISKNPPLSNLSWGIQTGPLLIIDKKTRDLNLKNDKPARRIVAGITQDNKIIFIVIYKKDSVVNGPNLKTLPDIIPKIQEKAGVNIKHAINLDGGSHSTFFNKNINLPEISRVGSYFCIK